MFFTGKSLKKKIKYEGYSRPLPTKSTIIKLKLYSRGAVIHVLDKLKTIKDTANFVGLSPTTVSKYIADSIIWRDTYYFKMK